MDNDRKGQQNTEAETRLILGRALRVGGSKSRVQLEMLGPLSPKGQRACATNKKRAEGVAVMVTVDGRWWLGVVAGGGAEV